MSSERDLTAYYRLEQVLSWTATARTFRGVDPKSGRPVAVKLLSVGREPAVEALLQRFEATVGVLRSLSHKALPRIVESGATPSRDAFMVCEWIDGESLDVEPPVAPGSLLPVIVQVVEALESLSLHGLVHLNLRPANILVDREGAARLVGWGRSLLMVGWQSSDARLTVSATSDFEAPELREAPTAGNALWRADAYSLALLTARLLGARIEGEASQSPRVFFPGPLSSQLSRAEELRQTLQACLERPSEHRPDSYSILLRALQHAMPRDVRRNVDDTQPMAVVPMPLAAQATVAMRLDAPPTPPLTTPPPAPPPSETPTMIVMRDLLADVIAETNALDNSERDGVESPPERATVAPPAENGITQPLAPAAAAHGEPPLGGDTVPFGSLLASGDTVPIATVPISTVPIGAVPIAAAPNTAVPIVAVPIAAEPTVAIPRPAVPPVPKPGPKPAASPGRRPPPWAIGAMAGVLGLLLLAAVVWIGRALLTGGRDEPPPAAVAETPSPPRIELAPEVDEPAPSLVLPQPLVDALDAIARKRWLEARRALGQLEDLAEGGELSAEVWTAYRAAIETVDLARRDVLLGQLERGLGDVAAADLERALRTMVRREEVLVRASPRGGDLIDRARALVRAAANFEEVMTAGAGLPALEQALRLEAEMPALAERLQARTRAAASIDEKVAMLMEADRLEEARGILVALDRLWPDRPGTAQAVASIDGRVSARERYEGLLAQIEAAGRRRPHEGLEMLEGVEPPAEFRARFEQLRGTLRMRFVDLDRESPELELVSAEEIEYKKGQPITIELLAADDYEVVAVGAEAMVAPETAPRALPVTDAGGGRYLVEIEPTVHDDRPLVVWFFATDRSGHTTHLGNPEQGLELRRKRWFDSRRKRGDEAAPR